MKLIKNFYKTRKIDEREGILSCKFITETVHDLFKKNRGESDPTPPPNFWTITMKIDKHYTFQIW